MNFCDFEYPVTQRDPDNPPSFKRIITFNGRVKLMAGKYVPPRTAAGSLAEQAAMVLDEIHYAYITNRNVTDAIISVRVSSGGSQRWGYLYLYAMRTGTPTLIQAFEVGDRANGGLYRFFVDGTDLVIDINDPSGSEGDCCSVIYKRFRYRWDHDQLIEMGRPIMRKK